MRILVTGASGNIGRHVREALVGEGHEAVSLVRDRRRAAPGPAVIGDLTDPATLRVPSDAVFLIWPGLTIANAAAAVDALAQHTKRIVYVSSHAAESGFWGAVESRIRETGVDWTFLRVGGLATNALGWADQIRDGELVRWPYGQARRSLVHEADVADVAVRALVGGDLAGACPVLTGPESLSQADQVRLIGAAVGRHIRWEDMPVDRARAMLRRAWGDEAFVDAALTYWATLVETPETVSPDLPAILRRPARTFAQWAVDHARDFRAAG